MSEPVKLEIGQYINGCHHDIWCYDQVPSGMRPATLRDMWPGRPYLTLVLTGPDKGKYYTGYYIGNDVEPIRYRITHRIPVYVKDNSK